MDAPEKKAAEADAPIKEWAVKILMPENSKTVLNHLTRLHVVTSRKVLYD